MPIRWHRKGRAERSGPCFFVRLFFPLNPPRDFGPIPVSPRGKAREVWVPCFMRLCCLAALFLTHPSLNRHLILTFLKLDIEFFHKTRMIPSESILLFLT